MVEDVRGDGLVDKKRSRGSIVQDKIGGVDQERLTRTKRNDRNCSSFFLPQYIQDILISRLIRNLEVIMRVFSPILWRSEVGMGYGDV
jgi:hypothetical protein